MPTDRPADGGFTPEIPAKHIWDVESGKFFELYELLAKKPQQVEYWIRLPWRRKFHSFYSRDIADTLETSNYHEHWGMDDSLQHLYVYRCPDIP